MPELATTVQVFYYPFFFMIAAVLIVAVVLFLIGLLSVLRNRRNRPPQSRNAMILALAIGFASVTGLLGFGAFQLYASENGWSFTYSISIDANGTAPEAVVVPIPKNESLLSGLHLTWGTANWSLVDTPKGRGLYVRFIGSAGLDASITLFPPLSTIPDTTPSLVDSSNASEFLRVWVFYRGGEGGRLDLSFPSWYMQTFLVPGWISVSAAPILPPLA